MGRHGGGSRSGGSSGIHTSSSSSSGRGARTSSVPFVGCYNRSYYDRHGRFHRYYTSDINYGTKSGWNIGIVLALVFITAHMLFMLQGFVQFGSKVDGDASRIFIKDNAGILTSAEEQKVLDVFNEVYEVSGMPITLYTEDYDWKNHYDNLQVKSEELYYSIGFDEDAMLILFTTETIDGFFDWEYDMYCGDNTTKCFSDDEFEKVLTNFQKAMANQNVADALDYSWNSVMDDLGKTNINLFDSPISIFLIVIYGIFYVAIISGTKKSSDAYKYFKENPEKLEMKPMVLHSECPACGASNTAQTETCAYCGTLLKIEGDGVRFSK